MDYKHERILEIKLTTDAIKSLSNWIVDDQKLFQLNCFSVLQAYYREGVALQCLGKHADALAAFSQGLAQDPKSLQLLAGLVEAAMKSPLKGESWYKNIWANFSGCVSGSKMRLRNMYNLSSLWCVQSNQWTRWFIKHWYPTQHYRHFGAHLPSAADHETWQVSLRDHLSDRAGAAGSD